MCRPLATLAFAFALVACARRAPPAPRPRLVGRAVLAADTFADGPPAGRRLAPSETRGRPVPFARQPVQGFSAVLCAGGGALHVLVDNGFGRRDNSDDARLRVYTVRPTFARARRGAHRVEVRGYFELRDPDRRVPFAIADAASAERALTGADFDPESFRRAPDGTFWFGDEFGPFLLHTDATGRLLDPPLELPVPAAVAAVAGRGLAHLRSPDHPALAALPDRAARDAASNVPASRGVEALALAADGAHLYAMLEGALRDDPDRRRRFITEFDLRARRFTGRAFAYQTAAPGHSVAELVALDARTLLAVERDTLEGRRARYKRVVRVDLGRTDGAGFVARHDLVDLLALEDPGGISGPPDPQAVGLGNPFALPYETLEALLAVDPTTLLVVNDNNYPLTSGRVPGAPDDTEFVLVGLGAALPLASREACPSLAAR